MSEANYVQDVMDELAGRLPDCDTALLELYTLLALTAGKATTLQQVHDAWAVWRNRTKPDHPSLIPFADLAPMVQALDYRYADAIRAAAPATPATVSGDGQAVYEAWQAIRWPDRRLQVAWEGPGTCLTEVDRAAFDAGAEAVAAPLREQLDALHRTLDALTAERDDYRKLLDQAYERLATVSGIVFGAGDDEAARCHLRDYLTIRDDTHEEDEDTDA